jgi:hypothetical protein
VSQELWEAAHASFGQRRLQFSSTNNSGVSKSSTSKYLFSGLLVCGECGSKLVIVSGNGKRGYQKYGCPSHRYQGICSNGLMIRQDRLEEQLLAYLEKNILTEEMAHYTVDLFEAELNKRLTEMAEHSDQHQSMVQKFREESEAHRAEAERIGRAIAASGHSETLLNLLAEAEQKMADVQHRIDGHRPPDVKASVEEVREYAYKALLDLRSLLRTVTQKAKVKLAQHVRKPMTVRFTRSPVSGSCCQKRSV